jgi:alpha-tubulin suppressor-like RCC1 family protein
MLSPALCALALAPDPAFATTASAISANGSHTCAITTAGGVKCWGINSYGQLGDGTTTQRTTPVDVSGLPSGVSAISAGYDHTCARTTAGGIKCWGYNVDGELGDGTATGRTTPVDVSGLPSGVSAVTAGYEDTCARTTAGGVKCWGYNGYGQLGDGTTTDSSTPVDVTGLTSGVTAISVGYYHACALTTAGGVKCWGGNSNGQLGDGTNTASLTPVDVTGLTSGVGAISASEYHTCALTTAGGVKCWGYNGNGRLGDGTTTQRNTPVDVSGLTGGVAAVSASEDHTCALTSAGGIKCWGYNASGQLGDGTTTQSRTPVDVTGFAGGGGPPPAPALGKSVNLTPVSGKVFVRLPGSSSFISLSQAGQLPTGSQIDSRYGSFKLTSATGKHRKLQSGTFSGAIVSVNQTRTGRDKGLTTFKLLLGLFPGAPSLKRCAARKASRGPLAHTASVLSAYRSRTHGRYRTRYGRASGSSVGTFWDTIVRCDGTLFKVYRGTVVVNDPVKHKTVFVRAGQKYLAQAKGK